MTSASQPVLGIDIGGSGIKGAPVDLATGTLSADRLRIPTPKKSTPKACADVVAQIVEKFADQLGDGPIGIAIPAPVVHGSVPMIACARLRPAAPSASVTLARGPCPFLLPLRNMHLAPD